MEETTLYDFASLTQTQNKFYSRNDAKEKEIPDDHDSFESALDKAANNQGSHSSNFDETGSNYEEEDSAYYDVTVDNDESDLFIDSDEYNESNK